MPSDVEGVKKKKKRKVGKKKVDGAKEDTKSAETTAEKHKGSHKSKATGSSHHHTRHGKGKKGSSHVKQDHQDTKGKHGKKASTSTSEAEVGPAEVEEQFCLADFSVLSPLGTGTFGRVQLVEHKDTGRIFALKEIEKGLAVALKQVSHVKNEKTILMKLNCPFIVRLFGTFQDHDTLYMVLDYVPGGEMFTILRKSRRFSESHAKFYAAEMVLALDYLHQRNIIYRDIKPENTLIDAQGHVKVVDFGFAKEVRDKAWTICGTPEYMAPEIILSRGHDKGVDWWALGVLIYEMIAGYPPYASEDQLKLYSDILKGHLAFPGGFPSDAKDLVQCLMTKDLTHRYGCMHKGVADIKNHRWFRDINWDDIYNKTIDGPWKPKVEHVKDSSNFITDGQDFSKRSPDHVKHEGLFDDW